MKVADLIIAASEIEDTQPIVELLGLMFDLPSIRMDTYNDTGIKRHSFFVPFMDAARFYESVSLAKLHKVLEACGAHEYTIRIGNRFIDNA